MPLRSTLALAATLLVSSSAALAAGGSFDRTLHTSATPTIAVFTSSGAIRVHAGSDVHIKANLSSSNHGSFFGGHNDGDIQARIQRIINNPPIQQSSDRVEIGDHSHNDLFRDINIDYDITLPAGSHLNLQTGSGDIEVQAAGDGIHADSGSGSVRIREAHGPFSLQSGSGDIELQSSGAGNTEAHTGSGSIRLQNIDGTLNARTGSGDIEASGRLTGNSRLTTGSGSVRLDLGHSGLNLNARTGSGSIRTNSPITTSGELDRDHVSGPINGGGPTVDVTTGSGDIELR